MTDAMLWMGGTGFVVGRGKNWTHPAGIASLQKSRRMLVLLKLQSETFTRLKVCPFEVVVEE